MHPAFSVIFFTVASGAGYGLFMLSALTHLFNISSINRGALLFAGILSLVLITAGLISSMGHLANPKNAWRAFFRFRTSWLSREGVFAVLFYPFALIYLFSIYTSDVSINSVMSISGLIAIFIALATVFSTGMIYACLKPIRQWHTPLTPTNYVLLAFASGSVILTMVLKLTANDAQPVAMIAIILCIAAAFAKAIYYFWIKKSTGPTINTATGFTRARVRLLDAGHTAGTFLTDEFSYLAKKLTKSVLKIVVFLFGFFIPITALNSIGDGTGNSIIAVLAVIAMLIGLTTERWLFFAEAKHVVNLYHGAQRT